MQDDLQGTPAVESALHIYEQAYIDLKRSVYQAYLIGVSKAKLARAARRQRSTIDAWIKEIKQASRTDDTEPA